MDILTCVVFGITLMINIIVIVSETNKYNRDKKNRMLPVRKKSGIFINVIKNIQIKRFSEENIKPHRTSEI